MLTIPYSNANQQEAMALSLFLSSFQKGWIHRQLARLGNKAITLRDYFQDSSCKQLAGSSYSGIRPIAIHRICGSQGKAQEFDDRFYPTSEENRSRWLGIARQRLSGSILPPVDLIEVGSCYYVRDGHHRISVARSLGEHFIDAEIVTINLEDESSATQDNPQ